MLFHSVTENGFWALVLAPLGCQVRYIARSRQFAPRPRFIEAAALSLSVTTLRMAAIPIAGHRGMKKVKVTCAPAIAAVGIHELDAEIGRLPARGGRGSDA